MNNKHLIPQNILDMANSILNDKEINNKHFNTLIDIKLQQLEATGEFCQNFIRAYNEKVKK